MYSFHDRTSTNTLFASEMSFRASSMPTKTSLGAPGELVKACSGSGLFLPFSTGNPAACQAGKPPARAAGPRLEQVRQVRRLGGVPAVEEELLIPPGDLPRRQHLFHAPHVRLAPLGGQVHRAGDAPARPVAVKRPAVERVRVAH